MSEPPKAKAEFLVAIEEAKQANEARLETLRSWREIADRLLANPLTTPDVVAMIEKQQEGIQTMLAANKVVEKQLADLFFEHDLDALFAE